MRTIGITGGTGFIGRHLVRLLKEEGNNVVIFTRKPEKGHENGVSYCYWNPAEKKCDLTCLKELDAMIHLAGAGIADKRWTEKRKEEIVDSRVEGTRFLISQLNEHASKCETFISASAIGYYGPDRTGKPFKEDDIAYNDFLGSTCRKWEQEAQKATAFARTAIFRFGIVLGKEGGAYQQFEKPVSFGVMPVMGSGRQVMSWIHVEDLARLLYYGVQNSNIEGVYNAVSPEPVTNKQLMEIIAQEKGGMSIPVRIPAFLLKLMLGEMSTEVLKSSTVCADKLMASGFTHRYADIRSAVKILTASRSFVAVPATQA